MSRVTFLTAMAMSLVVLAVGNAASAASSSRHLRSCRPSVGTDIRASGATCGLARHVVADSFIKSKLISGTHGLGFTVDGFRCRVTRRGSESKPIPARYRCQRGQVVITWAYHP